VGVFSGRKTRIAILALVVVALAAWGVLRYVSALDARFLAPSVQGWKGLASYLVGNYDGAAQAYRRPWPTYRLRTIRSKRPV
jgi:hypothetical protein